MGFTCRSSLWSERTTRKGTTKSHFHGGGCGAYTMPPENKHKIGEAREDQTDVLYRKHHLTLSHIGMLHVVFVGGVVNSTSRSSPDPQGHTDERRIGRGYAQQDLRRTRRKTAGQSTRKEERGRLNGHAARNARRLSGSTGRGKP